MRVLVTGGTGLLGSALGSVLVSDADWFFAGSGDGDLRSALETHALFGRVQPTHVVHLAGRVGGLFANRDDNYEFFVDNMRININVLEACRSFRVQKVVSCLSTCVFPDGADLPLTADRLHAGPPHPSNEGYAYAKRMVHVMSRHLSASTSGTYVCVVPTNMYGPNDNFDEASSHVIPALVRKAVRETCLRVKGTGAPLRQFLYSEDAARLVAWALEHYEDTDRPLILAPPTEVSIGDAARLVARLAGCAAGVEFDGDPADDGQFRKTAACDTPDFEFTPLERGLEKTIAWFLVNSRG